MREFNISAILIIGLLASSISGDISVMAAPWQIVTVDYSLEEDVGKYSSIALDSSDNVHISYYDETKKSLKYATNSSGLWQTETVDNDEGDIGEYSSIAFDLIR
jgi:hypothetical protein